MRKPVGAGEVVRGVDLEVAAAAFRVFVGPSGCGKSTLLRLIAGLEDVTAGALRIAGADRATRAARIAEAARRLDIEALLDRAAPARGRPAPAVAIGRAILREPRVFSMDEPLSNLDAALRSRPGSRSPGSTAASAPPWSTSPTTRSRR